MCSYAAQHASYRFTSVNTQLTALNGFLISWSTDSIRDQQAVLGQCVLVENVLINVVELGELFLFSQTVVLK